MVSSRKAAHICSYLLKRWAHNPKTYVLFFLLALYLTEMLRPIREFSVAVDIPVTPWIFPFVTTNWFDLLILLLGIILLFCEIPFLDEDQPYLLVRSGRKDWIFGQFLYILAASAIYFLFILFMSIIILAPNMTYSADWGKIISTLSQTDAGIHYRIGMKFPYSVLLTFSPVGCTLFSFFLFWLCAVMLGMLILVINLTTKKAVGTAVATFLSLFTIFAINGSGYFLYYISPMSWMGLNNLDITGTSPYPSIIYALGTLICLIVLLAFVSMMVIKKHNIDVLPPV